jgi:hypothetical protein
MVEAFVIKQWFMAAQKAAQWLQVVAALAT